MSQYRATHKVSGEVVEYDAELPQPEHLTADWRLEEISIAAVAPDVEEQPVVVDPALWRIDVGSFFDRFGEAKVSILASENPIVKAMITDASVRKYISLVERKDELTQMLGLIQTLVSGISLDVAAILETEPADAERWNG